MERLGSIENFAFLRGHIPIFLNVNILQSKWNFSIILSIILIRKDLEVILELKEQIIKYYQENIKKMLDIVSIINYKKNATKLILKDPQLVLYLNDLENVFPDHKLIIIIRDPHDVLASLKNVLKRKK